MPITYGNYTKQLKLLPLTLHSNGGAAIDVRYGFVNDDGDWSDFSCKTIQVSADDVSKILDAMPSEGMTRRDDLSLSVYRFLVENGHIEAGEIS